VLKRYGDFMKRNEIVSMFFVLIICGILSACAIDFGNGKVTTETRTVKSFESIKLVGVGDVIVHPSENYEVVVTTDSNYLDKVATTVNDATLYITQKNGSFHASELTVDVYMPKQENLSLELSGVGNINAQNFQVENGSIKHSGVGDVKIWATENLHGRLTGVGDIKYKGSPEIDIRKSGVGKISQI
jgi:hypothetical protein